jgi:uncharacterized protein (DUF1778 family)
MATRERVNMRLSPEIVTWAKRSAKTNGVSFTSIVEEALRDAMDADRDRDATARRIQQSRRLHAADV